MKIATRSSTAPAPDDISLILCCFPPLAYLLQKLGEPAGHTQNIAIGLLRPKYRLSSVPAEKDEEGVENVQDNGWLQSDTTIISSHFLADALPPPFSLRLSRSHHWKTMGLSPFVT